MKWTQAPPRAGSPAAAALSSVHSPSDWYTQSLVHGIRLMVITSVFKNCI